MAAHSTVKTANARMFKRVAYRNLNSRQKEAFNFQKVSAVLADYTTIRLLSDWRGADFIAQHFDGTTFLKIQLKSRLTFSEETFRTELAHMLSSWRRMVLPAR
jgi:hypothetical protein